MSSPITLEGKVAIITGASRGIGEAIARTFVAAGGKVVVTARKEESLAPLRGELGDDKCLALGAHGGKEDAADTVLAAAVAKFGKVDVLVNNAATNLHFGPLIDVDMAAWEKTFELNVKGYFWMARAVARHLRERNAKGSIIHVASVAGIDAAPLQGMYGMTKAAILSMTKTMAAELGGSGIRVNAIAPGLIKTRFSSILVETEAVLERIIERTPLGRYGSPEEIAGGALYLASDAASFLTGQTLVIDGGMTIA
jgi:NAD(P)-dependent dehydrogenase (short-subunit alcohol dehydrogenase family)